MAKKKKKKPDDDEIKKKKKRRREEEEELDEDVDADDDSEFEEELSEEELTRPRRTNDLYVGMATLALLALIGATVFFAVDYDEVSQLDETRKLGNPTLTVPVPAAVNKTIK